MCDPSRRSEPRSDKSTVIRPILQANRMEVIVKGRHLCRVCARARTHVGAARLQLTVIFYQIAHAVHHRIAQRFVVPVAHLKSTVVHRAFHKEPSRTHHQGLQEEDAVECHSCCSSRGARHLKVAHTREEGVTLHDVVGN